MQGRNNMNSRANEGPNRTGGLMQRANFQQNSSVNLLVDLNNMKQELRSNQKYSMNPNPQNMNQNQNNYRQNYRANPPQGQNYMLGNPNTVDIHNESRIDHQLPGYSKAVDVSRMSYDVYNKGNNNFNFQGSKPKETRPMNNNSYLNNTPRSYHPQENMHNSFAPSRNQDMGRNNGLRDSRYQHSRSPNRKFNSQQNNTGAFQRPSSRGPGNTNSFGKGDPSLPNYPPNQNHREQLPQRGHNPAQGNTQDIEKAQLDQFSKFLKAKEKEIQARFDTLPKICRKVAHKREKLQLQKELDDVSNEIIYVEKLIRGS